MRLVSLVSPGTPASGGLAGRAGTGSVQGGPGAAAPPVRVAPGPAYPRARPLRRAPRGLRSSVLVMQTLASRIHFPTAAAQRARAPRAMGNIQKKLTGKSEGGKRPVRGAQRWGRTPGPGAEKRGGPLAPAMASDGTNGHSSGGRGAGDPNETDAPPAGARLSPDSLKSQGNELFKNGQFAEAARQYSEAIAQLEPAGR